MKEKKSSYKKILNRIEKGETLIFPEKYVEWEERVVISSLGIYQGSDIDDALEIMTALENGASMEEAAKLLEKQNHSGSGYHTVRRIILEFSSKGPEFWEATAPYIEMSSSEKQMLEAKKQENEQLIQANKQKTSGPKL